jgi:bacterioferritin
MITKEKLLSELNKDLEFEYAAAVQYVQHASCLTGAEYQSIHKELLVHANEEMAHATALSDQIVYLGGTPTVDVEKREIDKSSKKMLEQDLGGERLAINRYSQRIEQAQELKLYGLEQVLKTILSQEEEHERDLQEALGL